MQRAFEKNKYSAAFAISLLLVLLVVFCLKPLFNSGDDTFVMYSFGGGFGTPPTELVDYSWCWHFLLGLAVKELFLLIPSINWYSVLLLLIHWISCSLIFVFFLRSSRLLLALLYYSIFFVFFEITLLLSLNFTNTSIICAVAGNVILIDGLLKKELTRSMLILPLALFLISGLLRFHAWVFVEAIFALFIFFLKRRKSFAYLSFKAALLIVMGLLYIFHQHYYKAKVPGWELKEHKSQLLISYYNGPKGEKTYQGVFKDSVEAEFFYNGFFYDSLILNYQRLQEIIPYLKKNNQFSSVSKEAIYWTFINARIYFLILVLPIFFLIIERKWDVLKKVCPFLIWSLMLYAYLFFFKKVTEAVFMGFLIMNWVIFALFSVPDQRQPSKRSKVIFIPLLIFCFIWGFIRIYKINVQNITHYKEWVCFCNDLRTNQSVIHIASDFDSRFNYAALTDSPAKFAVNNFISVGQFNKTIYDQKRQQFGLKNILDDMLTRSDLRLTGPQLQSLKQYFRERYQKEVVLVNDSTHYGCINVYRIISKN